MDYSARIQTIDIKSNSYYYEMIKVIYYLTGCPVIINKSFNVRGEPIIYSLHQAYACFMRIEMDYLIGGIFSQKNNSIPRLKMILIGKRVLSWIDNIELID